MAIVKKTRDFNGKVRTFTTGFDEVTGKAPTLIEHAELSERGLKKRTRLKELTFRCDDEGSPISIRTVYEDQQLDPMGGVVLRSEEFNGTHYTKKADLLKLIQKLFLYMQGPIYHGYSKGGTDETSIMLGHDAIELFDEFNQFIETPVTTPASYQYHAE